MEIDRSWMTPQRVEYELLRGRLLIGKDDGELENPEKADFSYVLFNFSPSTKCQAFRNLYIIEAYLLSWLDVPGDHRVF